MSCSSNFGVQQASSASSSKSTTLKRNNATTTTTVHGDHPESIDNCRFSPLESAPPPLLKVNQVRLLHIGKAGGGTFRLRARLFWNLLINQCHPNPCPDELEHSSLMTHYIVTLRDPIDRFVSAFYWRLTILCDDLHNETRIEQRHGSFQDPLHKCQPPRRHEMQLLFDKYQRNINVLTENYLCSNNTTSVEAETVKDIQSIRHAKWSLRDWITTNLSSSQRLFPIVLEGGFDFHQQIDDAILWANQQVQFTNDMEKRQDYINQVDCQLDEATTTNTTRTNKNPSFLAQILESASHSSSHHGKKNVPLSNRGTECLAQYLREDYQLLHDIRDTLCKTETCRAAIASILRRRESLLES